MRCAMPKASDAGPAGRERARGLARRQPSASPYRDGLAGGARAARLGLVPADAERLPARAVASRLPEPAADRACRATAGRCGGRPVACLLAGRPEPARHGTARLEPGPRPAPAHRSVPAGPGGQARWTLRHARSGHRPCRRAGRRRGPHGRAWGCRVSSPFLPFALPEIGDDEIAEVVDTLRSGWITTGPKAKRFELDFAAWLAASGEARVDELHCIAVNSATAGLHLALEALGIGPGDEVITTTHTFTATAEVVRYLGADVKLVAIDSATLNIDPAQVAAAIGPRTKALIPVHYGGLAADMPRLLDIARRHGLKVVEDAAHALPATSAGRRVGTLASDAAVFSFYANKTITTGEGGMLVTRDEALAKRARVMRLHGMNRDAFDRFTAKVPSWYYEIVAPGFKYNLTDIAAAIGLQQLKKAHAFQQARQAIAEAYDTAFAGLPVTTPPRPAAGDVHAWHLYALQVADGAPVGRDALIERLFERGIGCSVHYIPLHRHPYWQRRYGLRAEQFPRSEAVYRRALSLPIYPRMTGSDVQRVVDAVVDGLRVGAARGPAPAAVVAGAAGTFEPRGAVPDEGSARRLRCPSAPS